MRTATTITWVECRSSPSCLRLWKKATPPDLTDDELEKVGRDPFLAGYALSDPTAHVLS